MGTRSFASLRIKLNPVFDALEVERQRLEIDPQVDAFELHPILRPDLQRRESNGQGSEEEIDRVAELLPLLEAKLRDLEAKLEAALDAASLSGSP